MRLVLVQGALPGVRRHPARDSRGRGRAVDRRRARGLTSARGAQVQDVAVGHPYGYSYTVTKGIVSATGREIEMPNGYTLTDLIQTSTPIMQSTTPTTTSQSG